MLDGLTAKPRPRTGTPHDPLEEHLGKISLREPYAHLARTFRGPQDVQDLANWAFAQFLSDIRVFSPYAPNMPRVEPEIPAMEETLLHPAQDSPGDFISGGTESNVPAMHVKNDCVDQHETNVRNPQYPCAIHHTFKLPQRCPLPAPGPHHDRPRGHWARNPHENRQRDRRRHHHDRGFGALLALRERRPHTADGCPGHRSRPMDARRCMRGRIYIPVSREAWHPADSMRVPLPSSHVDIGRSAQADVLSKADFDHVLVKCRSAEPPLRTDSPQNRSVSYLRNFPLNSPSRTHATATYWS